MDPKQDLFETHKISINKKTWSHVFFFSFLFGMAGKRMQINVKR